MPRISLFLPIMIAAIALPGTAAYLYFRYTQDPTLRPLGLTQEALAKTRNATEAFGITVRIDWGRESKFQNTPEHLELLIGRTLTSLDVEHHFRHEIVNGRHVRITYVVGQNRFGPFAPDHAADGIRASIAALRMTQKARK